MPLSPELEHQLAELERCLRSSMPTPTRVVSS